jgi:MFS family permease
LRAHGLTAPDAACAADSYMGSHQRQAFIVVASLFVSLFFVMGGSAFTVGLFFPPLIQTFHWSHGRLSLMYTAFGLAMGLASPVTGWLIDRTGVKAVMAVGAVMVGAGYLVASQVQSFGPLIAAFLVIGAGVGFSTLVPTAVVAARWFSERRAFALGVSITGTSIGGMVMPLVVEHLIRTRGWRTALGAIAAPVLAVALPLILFAIRLPSEAPIVGDSVAPSSEELPGLALGPALCTRSFWMLALMMAFAAMGLSGAYYHIVPFLVASSYTAQQAAFVLSLQAAVMTVGFLVMGYLSDRFSVRIVLPAALFIEGVGVASLLGARNPAFALLSIAVFLAAFGITAGATSSLVPIILAESLGLKRFGTLTGLINLCGTLGGSTGPLVVGAIFDLGGSYGPAFQLCALLLVLGALATLFVSPAQGVVVDARAALRTRGSH